MSAASEFFDSLKTYEGGKKFIVSNGDASRVGYVRDTGGKVSVLVREEDWAGVQINDQHKQAFTLLIANKCQNGSK